MSLSAPGCLPVCSTILALPSTVCRAGESGRNRGVPMSRPIARQFRVDMEQRRGERRWVMQAAVGPPAHLRRQLLGNVPRQARAHACGQRVSTAAAC